MRTILTSSLLLLTLILSSCSAGPAHQTVTLNFWTTTSGEESAIFQERIDAFQKEHANIKVNLVEVPYSSASNQFKSAILGDQSVDILRADGSWVAEFADLGILYSIGSLASEQDLIDFMSTALESYKYQDDLYGLPSVIDTPALLYNKRILKEAGYTEPPGSMDELLKLAKSVTNDQHYGIYLSGDSYFALPYIWAFGGGTISDDRKIEITSKETQQALNFMLKLKKEGVVQPASDLSGDMMDDFKNGRAAMIINGPWAVSDILSGREFKDAGNLGIAQIPKGPKGQGSPIGGHGLVISKYSEHPQEAYELIRYLTSAETQLEQSVKMKTLPTRTSVYKDQALMDDAIVQGFKNQLDTAKSRPRIPESSLMFSDFTPNLTDVLQENQSVQQGVNQIERAWKSLLRVQ